MSANKRNKEQSHRHDQAQQFEVCIPILRQRLDSQKALKERQTYLHSVATGLYEELDKLCKKSAADEITELMLTQINDVISETKALAKDDPYVQRYSVFVAAGDNPQQRDAVVMLRQVLQALDRFGKQISADISTTSTLFSDAKGLRLACSFASNGDDDINNDHLQHAGESVSNHWVSGFSKINFYLLDRTDIPSHFR